MSLFTKNRKKKYEGDKHYTTKKIDLNPVKSQNNKKLPYSSLLGTELWSYPIEGKDKFIEEKNEIDNKFSEWKLNNQYPNFIPKSWTDCYKLPLHLDNFMSYIWTAEDEMALSSLYVDWSREKLCRDFWEKVVNAINGTEKPDFEGKWSTDDEDEVQLKYKGNNMCLVRGWGHLTGFGWALNLPSELAAKMQDQFIEYIITQLNGEGSYKTE